jgi:hypothetical protein
LSWALVAYSGGRDQEDHGLKPAQANSSARPYLKKPFTKMAGAVAQGVDPEFKPQQKNQTKTKSAFEKKELPLVMLPDN